MDKLLSGNEASGKGREEKMEKNERKRGKEILRRMGKEGKGLVGEETRREVVNWKRMKGLRRIGREGKKLRRDMLVQNEKKGKIDHWDGK